MTTYHFEIHTGDESGAGTDANIYVILHGEREKSDEYRLNGYISGNAFERNKTDEFSIDINVNCGDIHTIELRSDCRYAASDWLLDIFKIKRDGSWLGTTFYVKEWIKDKNKHTLINSNFFVDFQVTNSWLINQEKEDETYHIPAGSELTAYVNDRWECTLDYNTVYTHDEQAGVDVVIPLSIKEYNFHRLIDELLIKATNGLYNTVQEFNAVYKIPPANYDRIVREQWTIVVTVYTVYLANMKYQFSIPTQKIFEGFKDISTGQIIEAYKEK